MKLTQPEKFETWNTKISIQYFILVLCHGKGSYGIYTIISSIKTNDTWQYCWLEIQQTTRHFCYKMSNDFGKQRFWKTWKKSFSCLFLVQCLEMTTKRKIIGRLVPCRCFRGEEEIISVLDYSHCSLQQVPKEVFNFERTLEELYLDANQIEELPKVNPALNLECKYGCLAKWTFKACWHLLCEKETQHMANCWLAVFGAKFA